jgi:hypothetical protein
MGTCFGGALSIALEEFIILSAGTEVIAPISRVRDLSAGSSGITAT